jgi:signal transduction histidine kinase
VARERYRLQRCGHRAGRTGSRDPQRSRTLPGELRRLDVHRGAFHDVHGEVLGVLDLSVPNEYTHTHAWGWMLSVAKGIESRLGQRGTPSDMESWRRSDLRHQRRRGRGDRATAGGGGTPRSVSRVTRNALDERDNMLAVVSHDLRNPLSTILMASSLLGEDPGSAHRASSARVARSTSRCPSPKTEPADRMHERPGRTDLPGRWFSRSCLAASRGDRI